MNKVMRILHIVNDLSNIGGIQKWIMNYFEYIDRNKIVFDFAYHNSCEPLNQSFVDKIYKLVGNIIELHKISVCSLQENTKIFREVLHRGEKYKIVHCHMANAAFLYLKVAKEENVPVRILHSHQNKAADQFSHVVRNIPLIKMGLKYSNLRFACSSLAGDWLFKNQKYQVIPNAIDLQKFNYSEIRRKNIRQKMNCENKFVIGSVGRLCAQKNYFFAIDIFSKIKKLKHNAVFWIIGIGPLEQKLKAYVEALDLKESVIFLGSRNDISDFYQGMDAFFLPSLYEGLGIVNIEAQASGLHCVVSDAMPEEVFATNLIEAHSLEAPKDEWVNAFLEVVDSNIKRKCSLSLLQQANFDIKQQAKNLEKYYLDALDDTRRIEK